MKKYRFGSNCLTPLGSSFFRSRQRACCLAGGKSEVDKKVKYHTDYHSLRKGSPCRLRAPFHTLLLALWGLLGRIRKYFRPTCLELCKLAQKASIIYCLPRTSTEIPHCTIAYLLLCPVSPSSGQGTYLRASNHCCRLGCHRCWKRRF